MKKILYFLPLIAVVLLVAVGCSKESQNEPSDTTGSSSVSVNGALLGKFSVSATTQVVFSQGNLQYQASTNTWRFAENQWDMVGVGYGQTNESNVCLVGGTVQSSDNRKISSTYSSWIDLFGWGTGNNPTNTSTNHSDYSTFTDWGVNAISNGGNTANTWRTLTNDEWDYLFNTRTNASSKYGVAEVNGVTGMLLLPDDWIMPAGLTFTSGVASDLSYFGSEYYRTVNEYTAAQWLQMESTGAVFLPAAGYRHGTSVYHVGYYGRYWSSTPYEACLAYGPSFYSLVTGRNGDSSNAQSVRLVR